MNKTKIFFIGIGGIGMSGLAIIAKNMGMEVEGSDISKNYITEKLKKLGIKVYEGHNQQKIKKDISIVVISSAIKNDNPQILKAKKLNIPILKRAEFLAFLSKDKKVIAVAGCHGKTTTTGMISSIFEKSKKPYNAVIGGILKHIDTNAIYSEGDYFIIEADESDGSFLSYNPLVSCITNIDSDHLDYYKNINSIKEAFIRFINKTPFYGRSILCGDDKNLNSIIKFITSPYYTYGFSWTNTWTIRNIIYNNTKTSFQIYYNDKKEDKINLNVFGKHNILNSVAAYIASRYLGIDRKAILEGLYNFKGMKRRLDLIKKIGDTIFYDDYAHHPSEIKATLSALKNFYPNYKIIAIFQPHRFSRTFMLIDEFSKSFKDADEVYLCDIYSAGEQNKYGITKEKFLNKIRKNHPSVKLFTTSLEIIKSITPKTIVITLGAGDVYKIINEIALKYESLIQKQ
ncbi:MAG: UDP-N-acetylmuramate--L-alanine ligase [Elusimicrobiales bacterium]|nr:UDP-N-acetylmuramate--L-alanine ligase [Elusimicrobiales bacterium]